MHFFVEQTGRNSNAVLIFETVSVWFLVKRKKNPFIALVLMIKIYCEYARNIFD